MNPFELITQLPIDPYHKVADVGCGDRSYTVHLGKYLAHGKLYALTTNDDMLPQLETHIALHKLGNIEILQFHKHSAAIPDGSMDGVLLAFVMHMDQDKKRFLKASAKLLKKRGWCCVLEWYRKETPYGPPLKMRIDPHDMASMGRDAGLTFLRQRDINGSQYVMLFSL